MKIPKLYEGSPSYTLLKCAVFAAPFELAGAAMQADAAINQANASLQANREQIQAQKEENDKAFRRNSSLGQKAQLMAAGLSEQQAMQVIAGNGAVGTAEPADIRSMMEGVDLTGQAAAMSQGLAGLGQAVGSTSDKLVTSLTDPTGGSLGAFVATPFLDEFSGVLKYIDKSKVHSFIDFENWANSLPTDTEQGKAIHALLNSKAFKRVKHFSPAIRSTNRFMNDVYTANLDSNQAFEQRLHDINLKISAKALQDAQKLLAEADTELRESQKNLTDEQKLKVEQDKKTAIAQENLLIKQATLTDYEANLKRFEYERWNANKELWNNYDKQMLLAKTEEFINQYQAYSDPTIKDLFVKEMRASLQGSMYLSLLNALRDKTTYDLFYTNPQFHWLVTGFDACNRAGMFNGALGAAVFGPVSAGSEVNSTLIRTLSGNSSEAPVITPYSN